MNDYEVINQNVAWLRRDSTEWSKAWSALAFQVEDYCGQSRSEVFDGWQYMGTILYPENRWLHEFRNRCFKGNRTVATVLVADVPNNN
jgi:hypothetical protein